MHPTTQGHRVISLGLDWRKVMPAGQMMYWHPALHPQGNKALTSPKKNICVSRKRAAGNGLSKNEISECWPGSCPTLMMAARTSSSYLVLERKVHEGWSLSYFLLYPLYQSSAST